MVSREHELTSGTNLAGADLAVGRDNAFRVSRAMLLVFAWAICAFAFFAPAVADDYPIVADKALTKLLTEGGRLSPKLHPFDEREHVVWKLSSEAKPVSIPGEIQCVSVDWTDALNAQMPYLVYMPEKDRLLMLMERIEPAGRNALIHSDDHGKTWSKPRWFHVDASNTPDVGSVVGLTSLGAGKLMACSGDISADIHWFSSDYGEKWEQYVPPVVAAERYVWDPLLVLRDPGGRAERLVQEYFGPIRPRVSQGYLRSSTDEGKTWTEGIPIPQWIGISEVNIIRAVKGDWVAACRTDNPKRFESPIVGKQPPDGLQALDCYSGLGVSVSQDEGKTWSDLKMLYEWGRHHPSMVLMPDGKIVMTYVVRLGYPHTADGFSQFGVEAVVSSDNGQTWDLDHRYVLAIWVGSIKGANAWYCGVQSTSTVLMPDGTILTAFGTGFRNRSETLMCNMDVAVVHWKLNP